ncbi:Dynamin GTPase [Apiospora hydei]|uniref:Dynamin GTPase n=1 Tax=Apiospora hydei TaxID=1337664 RepID=A0ABR1VVV5_9PEZI
MSELPQVTYDASALMGLRGHPSVVGGNAFASDVLRIEVTGHTDLNLTVVDLPGLISVANEEQTDADVELIREMVDVYVSSRRAIVLAVVQAGNDIANQSIVQMARKHDPQGHRTVGIITKADLINRGAEGRLADLAMNQGIHIERELPNVIEEIRHQLRETEANLESIGPKRSKVSDIRFFITRISMNYCQLVQAAVNGDYQGTLQLEASCFGTQTEHQFCITIPKWTTWRTEESKWSEDSMNEWVKNVYLSTRGRELPGSHNFVLLAELFREQSSPWEPLAQSHIHEVFATVNRWIQDAVVKTVPEARLRREIITICLRWLEDTRARADEELKKLIADENQHPITYNHYYTDNIQEARREGLLGPIENALQTLLKADAKTSASKSTDGSTKSISAMKAKIIVNMDQQACSEALICLNAYYKRKRDELTTRKRVLVASLAELQQN